MNQPCYVRSGVVLQQLAIFLKYWSSSAFSLLLIAPPPSLIDPLGDYSTQNVCLIIAISFLKSFRASEGGKKWQQLLRPQPTQVGCTYVVITVQTSNRWIQETRRARNPLQPRQRHLPECKVECRNPNASSL